MSKFICIRAFLTRQTATMAEEKLSSFGIESIIAISPESQAFPLLPTLSGQRLVVPTEEAEKAKALLMNI